jgi:hypothetical protein
MPQPRDWSRLVLFTVLPKLYRCRITLFLGFRGRRCVHAGTWEHYISHARERERGRKIRDGMEARGVCIICWVGTRVGDRSINGGELAYRSAQRNRDDSLARHCVYCVHIHRTIPSPSIASITSQPSQPVRLRSPGVTNYGVGSHGGELNDNNVGGDTVLSFRRKGSSDLV